MSLPAVVLLVLSLALLVDLGLVLRARHDLKRWGIDRMQTGRAVFLFGRYSGLLTWIKNRPAFTQKANLITGDSDTVKPGKLSHSQAVEQPLSLRQNWWEWALILFVVFMFCSAFLDLDSRTRLPGNESELFQTYEWVLLNSLQQYGQFPLWNPYVYTGVPYVADPMLYVYNPLVTVPVLLYGVRAGFKLAIFLSFLLAAFGMWRLGRVLGLGSAARIWMSLMYALAGQPVARFFQGEYLFVFAFAWLPWIFSSLFRLVYTNRRRYIAEVALFMALFYFCGNGYYQFYMLIIGGIFALLMLPGFSPPVGKNYNNIRLDLVLLKKLILVVVLTIGIISIHLLPFLELGPRLSKDINVEGSHSLKQIFLDYTSKDTHRPDAFSEFPAREEFYAYIGLTPFLALILLPFAWLTVDKRALIFFLLLLMFVLVWISMEAMPWYDFFVHTRFLVQFRILLRVLIFGSLSLIVLAAMGLDRVWKHLRNRSLDNSAGDQSSHKWRRNIGYGSGVLGVVALGSFMAFGVIDLYSTHRPYIRTQALHEPAYLVTGWLRQHDTTTYYVRYQANNAWYEPVISHSLRYIDMWFPYADIRLPPPYDIQRVVRAQPNYVIQPADNPDNSFPAMQQVATIEGYNIIRLEESLPLAFMVAEDELSHAAGGRWLQASDVFPLDAFISGPGNIEVIANGGTTEQDQITGYSLVVLVSQYPGWRLKIDGQGSEVKSIAGYLATDILPGIHRYEFTYSPTWFYAGLIITLFTLAIALSWIASEINFSRQKLRQIWQRLLDLIRSLPGLTKRILGKPEQVSGAVLRQGVIQPDQPLQLPDETRLLLTIQTQTESSLPVSIAAQRWVWASIAVLKAVLRSMSFEMWLFCIALLVYLSTRLIGLLDYPIYFFTDEAVQTLLAADLVRDGFNSPAGEFLPTYFRNVDHYNLSISVYLQVIPYLLFGKSAYITRLASVLMTLLAAVCVGLILRDIFKKPYWWIATLILSIMPAWFLHSRTAFEVVLMVSFYTAALYYYLLYRYRNPRYLYAALVLFALAFYTYSPGQVVVVLTGAGLLLSDIRFHWQNRGIGLRGLGLVILLVLPYLRFRLAHPTALEEHLITLNSYWIQPVPWSEKLARFWDEYLFGLNPLYWFLPNPRDLVRHTMKDYGHLLRASIPFVGLGLLICLKEIRSPAHRSLLIALLAAPAGAAMAQIAVTRALIMVIPASLLAALGLGYVLNWIEKLRINQRLLALGALSVLCLVNFWMLRDALVNGPSWFDDYGLGGMQYGARQLFSEAQEYVKEHPDAQLRISPVWANGPDILARFFLPESVPISLESISAYMYYYRPPDPRTVFVMTPEEFQQVVESGKFTDIQVDRILPYPNGQPGFYFVRLRYMENIEAILAAESKERRNLQKGDLTVGTQTIGVRYSLLDSGKIADILDGSKHTLARTMEANPFILELTFPQPRLLSGFTLIIGDTEVQVRVMLSTPDQPQPIQFDFNIDASPQNPQGSIEFGKEYPVSVLYLEIKDLRQGEPGHVHLWEIIFH